MNLGEGCQISGKMHENGDEWEICDENYKSLILFNISLSEIVSASDLS
jgi:hypothetical protein